MIALPKSAVGVLLPQLITVLLVVPLNLLPLHLIRLIPKPSAKSLADWLPDLYGYKNVFITIPLRYVLVHT